MDRRILYNAVKQQCMSVMLKPLVDKHSSVSHKLDLLNAFEVDQRRQLATELNDLEMQMQRIKDTRLDTGKQQETHLLGQRLRPDIDWLFISVHLFNGQRDEHDCRLHWQNYLHPAVNKDQWSREESLQLTKTVVKHQMKQPLVRVGLSVPVNNKPSGRGRVNSGRRHIDWRQVAILHGKGRTAFQCFSQYMSTLISPRQWTQNETRLLTRVTNTFQLQQKVSWIHVSEFFEGRSPKECLMKMRQMRSSKHRLGRWSPNEDLLLLKAVEKYGVGKWVAISSQVPNRSDNQCRERYLHQLSGIYVKEAWTKAADETLIDLMLKHGPTNDCAIIAEKTLKKPRKEIYKRFRHLNMLQKQGRELSHRPASRSMRKVQLLERSQRFKEEDVLEQVLQMHQLLKEKEKERPSNSVTSAAAVSVDGGRKQGPPKSSYKSCRGMKIADKLKLMEPHLIDASFLKSELKRNLPKYKFHPDFHGCSRLEKVDNSLDELIFARFLPKASALIQTNPRLASEKMNTTEQRLAGYMLQLITMLRIDYEGASRVLKTMNEPEVKPGTKQQQKQQKAKETRRKRTARDLYPEQFLNRVRKQLEEGVDIVDQAFQSKLLDLYKLRESESVQMAVRQYAQLRMVSEKVDVKCQIVQYPTTVVLPLPDNALDSRTSPQNNINNNSCASPSEELSQKGDLANLEEKTVDELIDILEEDDVDSCGGNFSLDIFSSCKGDADQNGNMHSVRGHNSEERLSEFLCGRDNKQQLFDPDLPVKQLIKKHLVREEFSGEMDEVSRQFFLDHYGTEIIPGETSEHVRVVLEGHGCLCTLIMGDLIVQLVNVDTNKGKRTLLMPIASLPFKVNPGANTFHLVPQAGNSFVFEEPTFEDLEQSSESVLELLEKNRGERALAKAKSLLESAIGRTFMSSEQRTNVQNYMRRFFPQKNKQCNGSSDGSNRRAVATLSPNGAALHLWDRLCCPLNSTNLLCRGLVCFKQATNNRQMMRLARSVLQQKQQQQQHHSATGKGSLVAFKYSQSEMATRLALFSSLDRSRRRSKVHSLLYQPIQSSVDLGTIERTCDEQMLSEALSNQRGVGGGAGGVSGRVHSILEEIRTSSVYALFKQRLLSLLLWPCTLSQLTPSLLNSVVDGRSGRGGSRDDWRRRARQMEQHLFRHVARRRSHVGAKECFFELEDSQCAHEEEEDGEDEDEGVHVIEDKVDYEALRELQRQLQADLVCSDGDQEKEKESNTSVDVEERGERLTNRKRRIGSRAHPDGWNSSPSSANKSRKTIDNI